MSTLKSAVQSDFLKELKRASASLDGAFAGRAKSFVDAGDELIKAVAVFRSLTSAFEALPTALSDEALETGSATLKEVAHDCGAIHDLIPDQIRAMEALASANVNIGKRLDLMRDNIVFVASIAINARIEASALKRNSQDMLTFTYDVANLAAAAENTINQYSAEQHTAHDTLQSAHTVLSVFASKHRTQLATVSDELNRNLQAIEGRRTTALNEAVHIGDRSRKIAASIGTLITALQISDFTSQRFAHVHEAVEQLAEGLAADAGDVGGKWWSGLPSEERAAVASIVASLQVAQIETALVDLRAKTGSIRQEISQLVDDATAMGAQGTALYGSSGTVARSFLGELAGRIDVAGRLLSDCQNAFDVVGKLNDSVGSKFGALHEQAASLQGIVGIVGGVRLIGLNAHLKSDSLGAEGRTLSAISRELRNSADFITGHARDLIAAMDQTVALFEELRTHNSAVGSERIGSLALRMSEALAAFQRSGTLLASALTQLSRESDDVRGILNAALDCMREQDDLELRLDQATTLLRSIASIAREGGETERAKERAATFFAQRYTMAAERNVHSAQTSTARARGEKFEQAAPAAEADDLESILF